jgi:hypothetical protein
MLTIFALSRAFFPPMTKEREIAGQWEDNSTEQKAESDRRVDSDNRKKYGSLRLENAVCRFLGGSKSCSFKVLSGIQGVISDHPIMRLISSWILALC